MSSMTLCENLPVGQARMWLSWIRYTWLLGNGVISGRVSRVCRSRKQMFQHL